LKTRKNRTTKRNVNTIRDDVYDLMTNKPHAGGAHKRLYGKHRRYIRKGQREGEENEVGPRLDQGTVTVEEKYSLARLVLASRKWRTACNLASTAEEAS
jgi:hypothetical protein